MDNIEISVGEAKKLLEEGKALFLDIRERHERDIAKIEGSVFMPLGSLVERMQDLEKDRLIVVYCHHGFRSLYAAQIMRSEGFKNVRSMAGGIDEWAKSIDPSMPSYD